MRKSILLLFGVLSLVGALAYPVRPQGLETQMDKVYADESHCLVAPEIRRNSDNPISCYCRDAIMDARYVWGNYLLTGKDRNLNGAYLVLWGHAEQMCGKHYDFIKVTQTEDWQWNGPQVTRKYPPDSEIEQIKPDSRGFRTVKYEVRLNYRDRQGRVAKVENFTAFELLPRNPKK